MFLLKKLSFVVILISVCTLANCTEADCDSQTLLRLKTLAVILEDHDASVFDLSQQRIYVNPEKIAITTQGLIVYVTNEKTFVLPELFSDCGGCFVSCSNGDLKMISENEELLIWWCGVCKGFRNMDRYGKCTRCGNKL